MPQRRLLLLSNSKLHGQAPLEWCAREIKSFFNKYGVTCVLLIPYATFNHAETANSLKKEFATMGLKLESIHEKDDPVAAVTSCEGIYICGGNTFLLLKTLYEKNLVETIRNCVLNKGIPFMGASAGSNVSTRSINTTNDMPICYPPSFEALNLVPFNINPHYIDPDPNSKHMGETREIRINEFLCLPDSPNVLGLREGTGLLVEDNKATLFGQASAKLFQKEKDPVCYEAGADLSFLLQ